MAALSRPIGGHAGCQLAGRGGRPRRRASC